MEKHKKIENLQQAMQLKKQGHQTALADLRRKFRQKQQESRTHQHATERGFQTIRQTLAREQNQKQEQIYHTLEESSERVSRRIMEF